jgi:digeranylgeranylglycerophospholipid reductase
VGDAVLKTLGIPEQKLWIMNRVNRIRIVSPKGKERLVQLNYLTALMLDRPMFERSLVEQAVTEGVEFQSCRRVTNVQYEPDKVVLTLNDLEVIDGEVCATGANEVITSKLVIDCSGITGIAAKAAGLHKKLKPSDIGVCTQVRQFSPDIDDDTIELWFGAAGYAPRGYTWIFPKGEYNNLGMGVQGGQNWNTDVALENFIFKRCHYSVSWDRTHSCLPLAPPLQVVSTKQCLVAGDAARFCIATTGAGIGMALFSGRVAGAIASSNIEGKVPTNRYDEIMHQTIIPKLERAYRLKESFCRSDEAMQRYFRVMIPLLWLHKVFPKWAEKLGARNMRFA